MSRQPSTHRRADDSTVGKASRDTPSAIAARIASEWERTGRCDLPAELRRFPSLAADRSVFLDLAQRDYRHFRSRNDDTSPTVYCYRFDGLEAGLLLTLHRLIEVEECLADFGIEGLLGGADEHCWPAEGDDFDGFTLLEEIGRGSVARVFLCRQKAVGDRTVVLKVSRLITAEAAALGRLSHAHVVEVYGAGQDVESGLGWICMPYHGHRTLQDEIVLSTQLLEELPSATALPYGRSQAVVRQRVKATARVFASIANALDYLAKNGVVHGDLKPSNVLLTPEGEPLLIDFNLSAPLDGKSEAVGGTLPYMAPEQLRAIASGQDRDCVASTKTELYSFGLCLYQMLAERSDLTLGVKAGGLTSTASALLSVHDRRRSLVSHDLREVDQRLVSLINSCIDDDPANRPNSFTEVQEVLESYARPRNRFTDRVPTASLLVVSLILAAGVFLPLLRPQTELARLERQVHAALAAGKPVNAIALVEGATPQYRNDVALRSTLASTLLDLDQAQLAADQYMRLWEATNDPSYLVLAGYSKNLAGDSYQAVRLYEAAIDEGDDSPAAVANLGISLVQQLGKHWDDQKSVVAHETLSRAYQLLPRNESVRIAMFRHQLLTTTRRDVDRPRYPASVASMPQPDASDQFVAFATSFLATIGSDAPELSRLAGPLLARLAAINSSADPTVSQSQQMLASAFRQADSEAKIIPATDIAPRDAPPLFVDPTGFQKKT
ncbi:MAG: serine/threonine-protein kinase [Planctomycetota bacterium]